MMNLQVKTLKVPIFIPFKKCWQYFQDSSYGDNCKDCLVFKKQLEVCFPGKKIGSLECLQRCDTCQYYIETYFARIQFIHQISLPAAVYKGFHIWGGNSHLAKLCGIQQQDLPGVGIEQICHFDSLETVISNINRRMLGILSTPSRYSVFLKNNESGKIKAHFSVYPLNEPSEAFLVLAEQEEKG